MSQISNYSKTPRNIDGGVGNVGRTPFDDDVDGYVRISPGDFFITINKTDENGAVSSQNKTGIRSSNVFHELTESYGRTTLKMPYLRPDGSGAHQYAIDKEGKNTFGNPKPGTSSGYIKP